MAPIGDERSANPGGVAGVVGDEGRGADGGPAIEVAVDDFDSGKDAFDGIGDLFAGAGRAGGRKITRHFEGEFGFHHAHEIFAGGDAGGAVESCGG